MHAPTAIVRLTSLPVPPVVASSVLADGTAILIVAADDGVVRVVPSGGSATGASGVVTDHIVRYSRHDLERIRWHSGLVVAIEPDGDGLRVTPIDRRKHPSFTDHYLDAEGLPVPPHWLAQAFTSMPNLDQFLSGGAAAARKVIEYAARGGVILNAGTNVLDFGCGCGRLSRYLGAWTEAAIAGCDLHSDAIAWCVLPRLPGRYYYGREDPPLPEPDGRLDLIVAISVLTHMDEGMQRRWMAEWSRVLRPGGLLVATYNGPAFVEQNLAGTGTYVEDIRRQWAERDGFAFMNDGGWAGIFPDSYQTAYQTEDHLTAVFRGSFDVIELVAAGKFANRQNAVVLRNLASGPVNATPV